MNPTSQPPSTQLGLGSSLKIASPSGAADLIRSAMRDGSPLVTLRSGESAIGTTVECVVRPADTEAAPQILGPYAFASQAEARSFGDELMLALEYLGCELAEGDG